MSDTDTPRTDYEALSRNEVQHLMRYHFDNLESGVARALIYKQFHNLNDDQLGRLVAHWAHNDPGYPDFVGADIRELLRRPIPPNPPPDGS